MSGRGSRWHRVGRWLGWVASCAACAACDGCQVTVTPRSGAWQGTTSENLPIEFRVGGDGISRLRLGYAARCVPAETSFGDVIALKRGRFYFEEDVGDTQFSLGGRFDSDSAASGTLHIFAAGPGALGQCAADAELTWSARHVAANPAAGD